jgi:hypothetical protein
MYEYLIDVFVGRAYEYSSTYTGITSQFCSYTVPMDF